MCFALCDYSFILFSAIRSFVVSDQIVSVCPFKIELVSLWAKNVQYPETCSLAIGAPSSKKME